MTQRLFHFALRCLLTALLGLALLHPAVQAAEVDVQQAQLESSDDNYRLAASFSFELNRGLEDAVLRGIALYFTTDVELTRRRWYWLDEKTQTATQTVRVSYNLLTRQYNAAVYNPSSTGRMQQSFATLDEALALVRRPSRWVVVEKAQLKSGENYQVALRMRLDLTQLPKPFQVNAINNSDWRLSSDWKHFTFRAD